MESHTPEESICYEMLPLYAQLMELSKEQIIEIGNSPLDLDERDQIIYEEILEFSRKYRLSFYSCAVVALSLYSKGTVTKKNVEKHLLSCSLDPNIQFANKHKEYKTVMIVGRSGEGKSTTINHLAGKKIAPVGHKAISETSGINLYVLDQHRLNIVDTEGLDGTSPQETNEELMDKIRQRTLFYLEFDASIDAILIMWCPLKNGKSGLVKTIEALQKSFGDEILKSCIAVIQGNWRPLAEDLDLTEAVPGEIEEIMTRFPGMPIMEYDSKSPQVHIGELEARVNQVNPYQAEFFEENQKILFSQMVHAFKLKLKQFEGRKGEAEKFCKKFEKKLSKLLCNRELIAKKKDKVFGTVSKCMRAGKYASVSGVVLGATGVIFNSPLAFCLGAGGVAAGATVVTFAAAVGGVYGLGKCVAWGVKKLVRHKKCKKEMNGGF